MIDRDALRKQLEDAAASALDVSEEIEAPVGAALLLGVLNATLLTEILETLDSIRDRLEEASR